MTLVSALLSVDQDRILSTANDEAQRSRRTVMATSESLSSRLVQPGLEVLAYEPDRPTGPADPNAGDATSLGGVVEPRAGDAEQARILSRAKQIVHLVLLVRWLE